MVTDFKVGCGLHVCHHPRSAIVFRVELTDQNDSAISRHPLIPEPV